VPEGPQSARSVLIAPGEGAEALLAELAELAPALELVAGDPVAETEGPGGVAAALSAYESQADRLAPSAAIVHGSGDRPLVAAISLVKLGIPVARLDAAEPGVEDLAGLLADHTIPPGEAVGEQVQGWLHRILFA
jgi:hypothetical protein